MVKYWRIGEFAKKLGLSSEFLKYYDKQDLIKPIWKDDMSYRYYADFQTVHLNEYSRLSRIGLSLNESKALIQNGSLDSFLLAYKDRLRAIEDEIKKLEEINSYAKNFYKDLEKIKNEGSWTIENLDDLYFTYFSQGKDFSPASNQTSKIKNNLVCQRVIIKSDLENFSYKLENNNFKRDWGFLESFSPHNEIRESEYSKQAFVKKGRFFVYCHAIPAVYDKEGKLADCVWDFSDALSILKKHNFKIRGDMYQERLCLVHEKENDFLLVKNYIALN